MMHTPTYHVTDLDETERWFERVFGQPSIPIEAVLANLTLTPEWPRNHYAMYTPVRNVLIYTIEPKSFVNNGVQRYSSIDQPHLKEFGWSAKNMTGAFRQIKRHGLRATNSLGHRPDDQRGNPVGSPPGSFPEIRGARQTNLPYV